jgi:antagonist of KipI
MSLKIIKAGIQDSFQDRGRYGYQWLGVNPGGAMDPFAQRVANMLVDNNHDEAVLEMHFPAAAFLFEKDCLIALGGANFSPTINGEAVSLWQPVIVKENSVLQFEQQHSGARCYLTVKGGFAIDKWLGSYSTNLKANAGGYHGKAIQKGDIIPLREMHDFGKFSPEKDMIPLPWVADIKWETEAFQPGFTFLPGHEWDWLTKKSKELFLENSFIIQQASDRMGYRLDGTAMLQENKLELVSTGVEFGTVQLLPDGQLILLMADHQTTGGYPRIAHVISAHLPALAQLRPGESIRFSQADIHFGEKLLRMQEQHLLQLQNACTFRLREFLKEWKIK